MGVRIQDYSTSIVSCAMSLHTEEEWQFQLHILMLMGENLVIVSALVD
jgi:hypothetical protein